MNQPELVNLGPVRVHSLRLSQRVLVRLRELYIDSLVFSGCFPPSAPFEVARRSYHYDLPVNLDKSSS